MLREDVADLDEAMIWNGLVENAGDLGLVRVADYPMYAGESGKFFGGALGVAASDQDARIRILAVNSADLLAHVVIGSGSDGTRVEHHDVGLRRVGGFQAFGRESGFQRRAVGLRGTAPEVVDMEALHCLDSISSAPLLCEEVSMLSSEPQRESERGLNRIPIGCQGDAGRPASIRALHLNSERL